MGYRLEKWKRLEKKLYFFIMTRRSGGRERCSGGDKNSCRFKGGEIEKLRPRQTWNLLKETKDDSGQKRIWSG